MGLRITCPNEAISEPPRVMLELICDGDCCRCRRSASSTRAGRSSSMRRRCAPGGRNTATRMAACFFVRSARARRRGRDMPGPVSDSPDVRRGAALVRLEGWLSKRCLSDDRRLKPAPGMRRPTSSLHPPFVRLVVTTVVPHCVGPQTRLRTALEDHYSSAPGALAQVRVIVSRSVIT